MDDIVAGIAFDLEGTVVDVERAHHLAHMGVAKSIGLNLDINTAIEKVTHFIGGPDLAVMQDFKDLAKWNGDVTELLKLDKSLYQKNLAEIAIVLRDGFREFFNAVNDLGLRVSIGSLTDPNEANYLLQKSGLNQMIPVALTVLANDVKNLKPAPDVFIETARRMDIPTSQQVVFEDSPRGVTAARAAGSKVYGMPVYWTDRNIADLKNAGAEDVFQSWKDISPEKLFGSLEM